MKLRKKELISAVVASLVIVGLSVAPALAGVTCNSATVKSAGNSPFTTNTLKVSLECNDTTPPWTGERTYFIGADQSDEMYATALTALATGQSVEARLGSATDGSKIFIIILNDI